MLTTHNNERRSCQQTLKQFGAYRSVVRSKRVWYGERELKLVLCRIINIHFTSESTVNVYYYKYLYDNINMMMWCCIMWMPSRPSWRRCSRGDAYNADTSGQSDRCCRPTQEKNHKNCHSENQRTAFNQTTGFAGEVSARYIIFNLLKNSVPGII